MILKNINAEHSWNLKKTYAENVFKNIRALCSINVTEHFKEIITTYFSSLLMCSWHLTWQLQCVNGFMWQELEKALHKCKSVITKHFWNVRMSRTLGHIAQAMLSLGILRHKTFLECF